MTWLDIKTAPDDGNPVLVKNAETGEVRVGVRKLFFERSGAYEWFRDDEFVPGHTWSIVPTHWMKIPE